MKNNIRPKTKKKKYRTENNQARRWCLLNACNQYQSIVTPFYR